MDTRVVGRGLALLVCLFSLTASAQATRTWVSGTGNDANPCSRTAPCQTFAGAISKTAAGGEIDVLDPAGYGSVTITKAITIDGHGLVGSVLATGTNGIVVSAGASDVVTLRGLSITGAGSGLVGVRFTAGHALHIEDSVIAGFATAVSFAPSDTTAQLFVRNSVISENTTAGLSLAAGQGIAEDTQIVSSVTGVLLANASKLTLRGVSIAGNTTAGITVNDSAEVSVEHGAISNNAIGVQTAASPATAVARLSEVMVSDNGTGVSGNVASFGNNRLAAGNSTPGNPATLLQQQ